LKEEEMETRQIRLTDIHDTPLDALAEIHPNLVLVFAAPRFFTDPELTAWLGRAFPDARRIGLSTAGEISAKGVSDDSIVITAIRFDRLEFQIAATELDGMGDSLAAGQRLAAQLARNDLKAAVIFSQGVHVNGSEVIAGAVSVLGADVPLTGGLAGDNGAFSQTWCLLDDIVSNRHMLALGLYGDAVRFAHGSFGGWQSFGPARQATRAQGNVLYELDGKPALDIYKRYLGDYAKDLPASGLLFPFALLSNDHQESGLIRTLLGIDDARGSLTLAGDIPEGGYVRLMHASTEALVDGAEAAARATRDMINAPDQGLGLLVSCIGRKLVMGDRVDEEVEAVGAVMGKSCLLTGFYSNGEISPYLDTLECKLHNQTMTITYIHET
jgi:hypothetical protein